MTTNLLKEKLKRFVDAQENTCAFIIAVSDTKTGQVNVVIEGEKIHVVMMARVVGQRISSMINEEMRKEK
jgi:hypothetical protein